jgi:hypothetical protein
VATRYPPVILIGEVNSLKKSVGRTCLGLPDIPAIGSPQNQLFVVAYYPASASV